MMIKKFFLTIFLAAMAAVAANAQGKFGPDSAECVRYLQFYKQYYDMKVMEEAIPRWRKAYELCPPTASQNMLLDGQKIMRSLIKENSKNSIYKAALIDTLMNLHDLRIANYPKYETTARNNKSLDMITYVTDKNQLYNTLLENMRFTKENTNSVIYVRLMDATNTLYNQGTLMAEDVLGVFGEITANIEKAIEIAKSQNKSTATLEKVMTDVEGLFILSNVANCESLIELFTPRFEATPDDKSLVSNIILMMSSAENCTDNDLFFRAAQSLDKLEPTHTSAHFLFAIYSSHNENDLALQYLQEAIDRPDSDSHTDAQYYLEMATVCYNLNQNVKAVNSAKKAIELDSSLSGKAYMIIANVWASLECPGNEIEERSPLWVAVDYLIKAKRADASLAETVDPLIARYSQYFPDQAEAFMFDVLDGDSYTVSCGGLTETTKVRTQK